MKYPLALLLLTLSMPLAGCDSANEFRTAAAGDAETNGLEAERRDYVEKIENRLDEVDRRIEHLRDDMADASADAQAEIERNLEGLGLTRERVESRLEQVKSSSANVWRNFKAGVDESIQELESSLDHVRERFET